MMPMTESTLQKLPPSSAPQIFDRQLLITRKLRALKEATRPAARDGGFLLDQVARDIAERLDSVERVFIAGLDLSDDDGRTRQMLVRSERVEKLTRLASHQNLTKPDQQAEIGTPEHLPAEPASLDLVTSALALQWINDMPGTLIQIRRALKPDGLFIGALIGGNTLHELREVLSMEEDETTGGISPKIAPFVDVRDFGGLLQRAGFALPVTDVDTYTVRYDNLFALMADLRAMAATNILTHRSRKPWSKARAVRAAQLYAERYGDPDGRIRVTFQVISFSGWAPSDIQQKPLRPGSAKARLADALGANEVQAGEKAES